MSDVLDRLRDARPRVTPPSHAGRSAAREWLLAAIEDEPPGLHARRVIRETEDRSTPHTAERATQRRDGLVARGRGRGRLSVSGALLSALVVSIATVVVVVALLVPGHRQAATPTVRTDGHGAIDARGGELLTGAHGALPAVIAAGLRREYQTQLTEGRTLRTTIDVSLQRAGMRSLRHSLAANYASSGAFVALDPRTGAVEAIGTAGHHGHAARVDSAITTAPPGSTFSSITALAALQAGAWTPTETYDDTGVFCVSANVCFRGSRKSAYGTITLAQALAVEDTMFLYELGDKLNSTAPAGGALQRTARRLGIGALTGIDLPDESTGLLPTPRTSMIPPTPRSVRWSVGDNIALAVGGGALAVTPVQLAVAYAAIANGGTVVTPHLAAAFTSHGSVISPPTWPTRRVTLSATSLAVVRQGLERNAGSVHAAPPAGVTADVFGSLHELIASSVGTSQFVQHGRPGRDGWYAGYVHADGRPLVVIVWIHGGGFGAADAAPVARQLFSQWITGHPGDWTPGQSKAQ
jgi:penicillin-binding protein 2